MTASFFRSVYQLILESLNASITAFASNATQLPLAASIQQGLMLRCVLHMYC